jgi:predicted HicB family RNase H-like nuclease
MSPKMTESIEKRESTSLKIRPKVWKEAKIAAIKNDMELSELVEEAIERYLKEES